MEKTIIGNVWEKEEGIQPPGVLNVYLGPHGSHWTQWDRCPPI